MKKYGLLKIKEMLLELQHPNYESYKNYWINIMGKTISSDIIPDWMNITNIDKNAFSYNTNLITIYIPSTITNIGSSAFYNCTNITDVYLETINPPSLGTNVFDTSCTIHVPVGSEETYKSATNWSEYADKIVGDVVIEETTESEE